MSTSSLAHPKVGGAAVGGALGTLIASVLASIHGVDLTAAAYAAIPTFLGTLGAWLAPDSSSASSTPAAPTVVGIPNVASSVPVVTAPVPVQAPSVQVGVPAPPTPAETAT